jgi:hypothetical protein
MTGLPQAEQGLDAVAGAARGSAAALDATDAAAERASDGLAGVTAAARQAQAAQTAEAGAARASAAAKVEAARGSQTLAMDLDGLDGSAQRSSQGLASIAMQMPDVIAGLASGQSAVTVFLQQGLQVFQSNLSSLLPLLASVGPALAVVGTAAAALGGVYLYLADSVEEAEEAMARSAAAATAMQDAHGQLGDVMLSLSDEVGLLTGAIDREAIAQRRRDQTIREGFGVVEQQLRLKEQSLALELAGVEAALRSGDVTKANVLAQQRLTEQLAAYAKTREQIVSRRDRALADSELVAFGQRSLREAGAAGAGRTVRATAAPAAEPPPVIVDMAALSREMQSFAVFTGGDLGPLSDALAESAEGFERASRALARARSPEELAAAVDRASTASAAVGVAGSALRGNLGGAVTGLGAMLGPSAAALGPIGAAIGVAQGIGATAEAQGVSVADVTTQAVEGAVGALVAVIEGLPDIIAQTIPVLVSALVVELPIAMVKALPDILAASLYNALIGLPKAIAEAIRDAITPGQEGGEPSTARLIGATVKGSFTGDIESEDVPTLIAAILLSRGRDRSRATSSRSATTARRAATTRPSPAAAPNPFRAFADAYDGQFAGPFGASPTTPQLRGT